MKDKIKAIIVDDERLSRQELKQLLKKYDSDIQIIGEAKNGKEGVDIINKKQPDLVFLDIQMPGMDGFEVINELENVPLCVFISAYDKYALEAFRVNALDYLLKPVDKVELDSAIQKIKKEILEERSLLDSFAKSEKEKKKVALNDRILIKDGKEYFYTLIKEIDLFESVGNYVRIHRGDDKIMILKTLQSIEKMIDSKEFFRANRKHIVNLNGINKIENWFNGGLKLTMQNGKTIEMSRRQSIRFKEMLSL